MNKIIPFKKDILFDTGINEVISISLEHNFHTIDNRVEGNFLISGDYKMNRESVNTDPFNKEVPFTIDIGENYKIDNIEVDIDDFYYEIINDNYLSVHIDLLLKNLEEIEIVEDFFEEITEEVRNEPPVEEQRCIEEEEVVMTQKPDDTYVFPEEEIEESETIAITNTTSTTYSTYKIYIMKEDESLENIMVKYAVERESLEKYNNLDNIQVGDKLIIPIINAGN